VSTQSVSTGTSGTLITGTGAAAASVVGLASGLDTTAIISQLIAVASLPMNHLQVEQAGVQAKQSALGSIQTALQSLSADAANLSSPTLFDTSQAVTSSNPALVAAASQTGAGIGGYEVNVTQLANSAQRTFTFASPASADTITIDGHTTSIAAGASIQDFVNAINNDASATVYAAATGGSNVVLSSRSSGDTGTNFIQVADPGSALSEQTSLAKQGRDAQFTVDGVAGTSSSNTVTNAIAGVSLTLGGLTTSGPVTVNVAPPAPSATNISTAINQFVTDYNSTIAQIQTQLAQTPVSNPQNATDAAQGTLYGDRELSGLLTNLRQMMYTPGSGLPTGLAALSDLGITTGAPAGSAGPSSSALSGILTVNAATLTSSILANPAGVQKLLGSFSTAFEGLVNNESGPGGVISQRVNDETSQSSQLGNQISVMQAALTQQQTALQAEYANLESALALSQSQESSLVSDIAQLP
jgi:flagellar hook-associated protein 2